ncbi:MAG: hypothetical protein ACRC9O_00780 [Plesiomonas sp.]|uniref:hypothetical protein n=1 Tax=Plesiomonas sp. TaxID=2486279 RepID=UPI003F304A36
MQKTKINITRNGKRTSITISNILINTWTLATKPELLDVSENAIIQNIKEAIEDVTNIADNGKSTYQEQIEYYLISEIQNRLSTLNRIEKA